ncbi:GlxA family transcriptional regulator [Billgrantia antri]|uniref:GlxA family transcriptional regulator n=1 Tax=Halomonas sulfidivorans TaxID=2733488 RepID=A0ABX7WAS9_9GAMM|nr:GlxA family transcriptional regulator [Halomonas sulfidivorans]QTP57453.1 GlxA family transcriptional regulator [Halomonas sulfidivorans]
MNLPLRGEPLSVGFVLLHRFTLLPFAAFVDCLRLAADEGDRSRQLRCHWTFMTSTGEPAASSCGASITPCQPFRDPQEFDYIVVIGGVLDDADRADTTALAYLRRAANAQVPLVGLCTGAFALIQAGLMNGRRCCVSWYHHRDMIQRFPTIEPVADRLFVDDGDRLTCAGGSAGADLAAYLVERHLGKAWAMKSLRIMLLDEARAGAHPQPQPVVFGKIEDRLVRRSIAVLEQHLGEPISMDALAERVGTSRRNLERRFRETLGVGPQKFARDLRLRYGLWLLHYTGKSVTEIGERCGFSDTAHFSRHFRSAFGMPPSEMRKRAEEPGSERVDPFFLHIESRPAV